MKTVKVRIAVAVDPKGCWNATGWGGGPLGDPDPQTMMANAVDCVDAGEGRYFVEVEVPVPEVQVIAGRVVPEEEILKAA